MHRRLIWAAAFSLGICAVTFQRSLIPVAVLPAMAITAAGLCLSPGLRLLPIFVFGLVWGNSAYHHALDQRITDRNDGATHEILGTVIGMPNQSVHRIRFDFRILEADRETGADLVGRTVRLRWYESPSVLTPGDQWRLKVKLRSPRGYRNQHGFDYERFLMEKGIQATGYVREGTQYSGSTRDFFAVVDRFRLGFRNHLSKSELLANKQMLTALAVGERSGLDRAQRSLLRESGLSHLVAISGLHIGLAALCAFSVAAGSCRLFARCCSFIPARHAGVVAGIVTALVYSLVAGLPISTVRALIMVLIGGILLLASTRSSLDMLLAASMFLVAGAFPLRVASPGFWLSFTAVWLIYRFVSQKSRGRVEGLGAPVGNTRKFVSAAIRYALTIGKLQLVLLAGMTPLLLFIFGEVPLASPLANFVAVPIFGVLVVPSVLIALGVYAAGLPELVAWVLTPADKLISYTLWLAHCLSAELFPSIRLKPVAGALIVIGFGVVGFIWLKARQLGGLLIGIGLLWGGSLVQASVSLRDGEFEITTLDVGQGLAMVVSTRNRVLVYDFGPRFGKFSLGDAVVLPHILGEGHRQIDAAVVSHGANDHAGGFPAVVDQFPIKEVFSGEPGSVPGVNCHLGADAPWVWDGVRFTFLKSLPNKIRDANDLSCVLSIQGQYASALLTGDIETPSEQVLVGHYGQGLQTDLLQIPHHGSKTSSTKNFLRRTAPRHALLSRGRQNRFNHPASEVVKRYERQQVRIWDTAVDGQVTFLSLRGGWQIETFSEDWAGFWH